MRVTEKVIYDSIRSYVMDNRDRLFSVQQRIAQNRKLINLSDDPRAAEKASQLRATKSEFEQFKRNISLGKGSLDMSVNALQGAEEVLVRAKEIAVQLSNGEYTAEDRTLAAGEVAELYNQMIGYANTKYGSEYVFSGSNVNTAAYSTAGVWQGDDGIKNIRVGQREQVAVNETGSTVFGSSGTGGVMKALADFKVALESNDIPGIQTAMTTLDAGMGQVQQSQAMLGTRVKHLEVTDTALSNVLVTITSQLSDVQDLDLAEMSSELAKQEAALQAALAVAQRISTMTILGTSTTG